MNKTQELLYKTGFLAGIEQVETTIQNRINFLQQGQSARWLLEFEGGGGYYERCGSAICALEGIIKQLRESK